MLFVSSTVFRLPFMAFCLQMHVVCDLCVVYSLPHSELPGFVLAAFYLMSVNDMCMKYSCLTSQWATANTVTIALLLSCLMSLLCQTAPLASLCSFTPVCFWLSAAVTVLFGSACWYIFLLTLQSSLLLSACLNTIYFISHKHVCCCCVFVMLSFSFCSHH